MSRTAKQHEALQTANKAMHAMTAQIENLNKQILTCVDIIDRQKELIDKLKKPARWWQVWK